MTDGIRYYYFGRTKTGNTNGIITCATRLNGFDVHVGFSFCSPKDNFKKEMGRRIALGRLNESPVILKFTGHSGDDVAAYIKTVIESDLLRHNSWPRWVKRVNLEYSIKQ